MAIRGIVTRKFKGKPAVVSHILAPDVNAVTYKTASEFEEAFAPTVANITEQFINQFPEMKDDVEFALTIANIDMTPTPYDELLHTLLNPVPATPETVDPLAVKPDVNPEPESEQPTQQEVSAEPEVTPEPEQQEATPNEVQ